MKLWRIYDLIEYTAKQAKLNVIDKILTTKNDLMLETLIKFLIENNYETEEVLKFLEAEPTKNKYNIIIKYFGGKI